MGCGRTGAFFSFEEAGITPDIVTVSKSISGYGLPMSLCLFKPELDIWEPGEHNGTFRGNNPAFVTATATLETYWTDGSAMEKQTRTRGEQVEQHMIAITEENLADIKEYRGRGLVWGLEFHDKDRAGRVAKRAFELGLLIETSGPQSEVVKLLPALTITPDELDEGMKTLARSEGAGDPIATSSSRRHRTTVIVRSFKEFEGTDRHVKSASGTWESTRIVLAKEKVGFSLHETILYAGTETSMWYANHIEAVVCTKGDAELTDRETGKTYHITPGTMYLLDGHERHTLKVKEDFHCICVFNPPVTGREDHDENGVYPLLTEEV
jgi:hypothetical protein